MGFPRGSVGTNLPAKQEPQEMWVILSLGGEDPLEEGMITTPVFSPGESPWTEEPGRAAIVFQRVRHN